MRELDKMVAAHGDAFVIGEFIDWLAESGYAICTLQKTGYGDGSDFYKAWLPKRNSHEEMLADYFEIDLKKIEEERRAILENLQQRHDS